MELSEAQENQSIVISGGNDTSGTDTVMDQLAQAPEEIGRVNQGLSGLSQAALKLAQKGNAAAVK